MDLKPHIRRARSALTGLVLAFALAAPAMAADAAYPPGYRIGLVGNAPSQDYPQTIVMYRRGFEGEGRRLARDLGVKVIGPLDGMRPAQLHGAQAVLILGG